MNVWSRILPPVAFFILSIFILSLLTASLIPHIPACAQSPPVRKLNVQFIPEEGCPVAVTSARGDMQLDPAGNPVSATTYIEYRNVTQKPIVAVRFRIRYYDQAGKTRGTQQGVNMEHVEPGANGSQKWPTRGIDPTITAIKIRALTVGFSGGGEWVSAKMPELFKQQAAPSAGEEED